MAFPISKRSFLLIVRFYVIAGTYFIWPTEYYVLYKGIYSLGYLPQLAQILLHLDVVEGHQSVVIPWEKY